MNSSEESKKIMKSDDKTKSQGLHCPVCASSDTANFCQDKRRKYSRCNNCNLIFVPPEFHLTPELEKAEYELHRNAPDDQRYRNFLSRMFNPMNKRIRPESCGLDFGSGPGPTLSVMFEEEGHSVVLYDKFYASDLTPFTEMYDFITATEVVEHLHEPGKDLERLWKCLKPGGWLGIMTKLALEIEAFRNWHYKHDMTHICFFSKTTFELLVKKWEAKLSFVDKDVILIKKPN